jgi:hypothetical protein
MATQVEIEAAAEAISPAIADTSDVQTVAKLALEAAERVRPRRDLTAAARMRQSRAKKRADRAVTRAVTPERAVTSDVTHVPASGQIPIPPLNDAHCIVPRGNGHRERFTRRDS